MKTCVNWIWTSALFVMGALIFLWIWFGGMDYASVSAQSRESYENSRPDSSEVGSYQFITRGIIYDMTEDQVSHIMVSANKTFKRMPVADPPWDGFVNYYEYKYGPPWVNPRTKKTKFLCQEVFWVFFDPSGRAKKMNRMLVTPNGFGDGMVAIDLKDKKIRK